MMKIILVLLLVALLLTACAAEGQPVTTSSTTATTATAKPDTQEPQIPKTAEVAVLSCSFKAQVLPADHEVYVGCFPYEEGEVYVDLVLSVTNTCEAPIDGGDITGYFEYAGKRYTMQFEVEETADDFANEDKAVLPGETKTVHLFYRVDAAAEGGDLTVHYSALGDSNEISVAPQTEPVKQELKIGDVVSCEGSYTVEVLDCKVSSSIRATGSGAKKYYVAGSHVFSLILRVRNDGTSALDYLEGYMLAGDRPEFAVIQMEVNNNLELEDLTRALQAGEEQILHLYVAVPEDTPAEGMVMRFNIMGGSYCCCAVG